MGQYFKIVNLDKKQFLNPHAFGNGLKLCEFGASVTMMGLAALLSDGNGRGGGDLHVPEDNPFAGMVGSWAGDRIVITGDYADEGRFTDNPEITLYGAVNDGSYENISSKVVLLLAEDEYFRNLLTDGIWTNEYKLSNIYKEFNYTPE